MQQSYTHTKKAVLWVRLACILVLSLFLFACDVELHQGLSEKQANDILAVLLENNIGAQKESQGKAGYAILVDEENIVRALDLLDRHNLPQESYQSLGSVFTSDGLVSSASSEKARMAFAISQELSDTFTRIDGVLTARVHVVLGEQDQAGKFTVEPSSAIFIRHIPDSIVVNYITQLQSIVEKSIPKISAKNISIALMPVRENVSVPYVSPPTFFETFIQSITDAPLVMIMLVIISLASLIYLIRSIRTFFQNRKKTT